MENFRHYQINRRLGDGNDGDTYLAWDSVGERQVVVKALKHFRWQDKDYRARYQTFIEKLATIENDRIAKYNSLEETTGGWALVRDYIEGESVAELIEKGFHDYRRFLNIARQTVTVLGAAHDSGILHLRICPNNLIIASSGEVTLVDFSFDSSERPDSQIAYRSHEQSAGLELTLQSDFYSLGVVWHQLLMGHLPSEAAAQAKSESDHSKRSLPPEAKLLLQKLLAKTGQEQFATVAELASTLREMAAVSYVAEEKTGRKKKRMTPRQYLGVSILVLLLVFYWWLISFYQR